MRIQTRYECDIRMYVTYLDIHLRTNLGESNPQMKNVIVFIELMADVSKDLSESSNNDRSECDK